MIKKIYFYNKEKEKIVGVLHKSRKKSDIGIIICHGFKGNKDRNLIKGLSQLLSKKYNILRFDFSGNGESEGKFENQCYSKYIEELYIAINYFKKLGVNEIIVIGHSLGTNIIILEQIKYKNINKIVLIAPGLYIKKSFKFKFAWLEYLITLFKKNVKFKVVDMEPTKIERILKLKNGFFLDLLKYKPQKLIKKIRIPLSIILAEKDKVINNKRTINLYKKLKTEKNLAIIKDAAHNFREEKYLNQVAKEILKWIASSAK